MQRTVSPDRSQSGGSILSQFRDRITAAECVICPGKSGAVYSKPACSILDLF